MKKGVGATHHSCFYYVGELHELVQYVRGFCQLHLYFSQVISGQQLPKPKDSILGDRGEVIIKQMQIMLKKDYIYI